MVTIRRYENVKIEKLKPYENNARTHSEAQIEKIAKSIQEFGFVNPVLIDSEFGIIAGHGRVLGAKKLGMTDVPCIFIEDLNEAQKRAYILADNKLALDAGWDNDILIEELEALKDLDFDISITGFEDVNISDKLEDINDNFYEDTKRVEHKLKIDRTEIILTDEEYNLIMSEFDNYVEESGVSFGFVKYILERKND